MVQFLKQLSYYGGVLLASMGLVLIVIQNETGHSPAWMVGLLTGVIWVCGLSIIIVVFKRGLDG